VNLGLTCQSPFSESDHLVLQQCPGEVTIDLDTARLRPKRFNLILDSRCVACSFYKQLDYFLTKYDIELQDENTMCIFHGCDQVAFHRSGRCVQHLNTLIQASRRERIIVNIRSVQEAFNHAARKRWTFLPKYDIVRRRIKDILQGNRPGADLVILDDEFSPASQQLWEFAIIERVSGKLLVNTTVEHEDGLDHDAWSEQPFLRRMSMSKAATVYSPSRISDIGRMNVHEIASKLQRVGITPDTVVLVYHKSAFDLRILRQLLESAGYHGILPTDKNCIPLLQLLRSNLLEVPLGGVKVPSTYV